MVALLNAQPNMEAVGEAKNGVEATREIIAVNPSIQNLTEHQLDMLASIVRGLTNTEISCQFGVSENTVRKATSSIFAKLGVANRTEAAPSPSANNW